eukprot:TRINITY_DN1721_c0_g2_i9.p1 TRINITY_DN1721_c0_g2~~TRINITY_DN1721_c0_g2_i9.p1  ORF type:complete len:336 (-),score=52.97 TRINITY_DN1721_c0_g2_i9:62-1069(-)
MAKESVLCSCLSLTSASLCGMQHSQWWTHQDIKKIRTKRITTTFIKKKSKKTADLPSVAESLPSRPSCSICKRAFSEKILPKECQVCSKSVCLVCLRNKLEDKLACDLCFLWKKTVESDEQMIAPLRQADEALQGAEKQMGVILQEIERTKASTEAEVRLLQDHEKSLHDIFLSEESQTQQEKEKFKKIYEALCTLKAESEKIRTEQESYERALGWADREIIDCNGEIVGKEILLEKRSEDFSKLEIQFEELRRSELIKGRAARTVPYDDASFLVKREDDDLPGHRSLGNGLNESSGHYNASLPQFVRAEREIFEPNQRPEGGGYYCLGRRTSEK